MPDDDSVSSAMTSIRIRPELRAAQVKRAALMTPATTLYFDEKYDLGQTALSSAFRKVSFVQALKFVAFSDASTLEVPEPLWLRFLPKNIVLVAFWKAFGVLRARKRSTVTYAIENNELNNLLCPHKRLPDFVLRFAEFCLGFLVRSMIDRIAYGSSAAAALYESLPGVKAIRSALIEELPAPAATRIEAQPGGRQEALFIGELDNRKGIAHLMSAWPTVEQGLPSARLTIAGSGRLSEEVETWCQLKPASRVFAGFVQHEALPKLLDASTVLLAPSCRDGRWREQIGLPIVEALAAGLTVVTTDETGLAQWLAGNGHFVISSGEVAGDLAAISEKALRAPLPKDEVRDSLPSVAGRIRADSWLHAGG
ncbi:glycosyltransferase family 4 protein [Pseudarthrobacter sp. BRE9]|uniref:glycosyltransferase family 4 protein n=1 Tax=Pseudarthrobacter sp. BRE9 TaxID=2962582 RepID=UPI0028817129|nr:glycosyltransferase family 4 protein [Pseudarthrobacter sp. BRE9]MDT0168127.1 glycosyltransferase family 4 protein [Pseudarthrobacter sp. BRE9]